MRATPTRVLWLTACCLAAAVPVVLWPGGISRAAALWPQAGDAATPWIAGEMATILAVPVLALSAAVLLLAPGLLLALLSRRSVSAPAWLLTAVPLAVAVAVAIVEVRRIIGAVSPGALSLGALAMAGAGVAVVAARADLRWPIGDPRERWPLVAGAAAIVVLSAVLMPKLLWESFNGDGAHAFEASRLLLDQPWPFFDPSAGDIAGFPGPTSMLFTWPNAWFLGLFGPLDAAVRLPFVVYLPLMVLALQALAEASGRRLGGRAQAALWVGTAPFALAMAYSASYEPYHADLALPGVQDLLLLIAVAGFCHARVRREFGWSLAFAVLCQLSLPNGLVLMGFWLVAELIVVRPIPWRAVLAGGAAVAASVAVAALLPALVTATGHPPPGGEYGLARAVGDVLRIDPFQGRRLVWWLVGGAIFPVVTLAWWRRQDDVARRVTLVAGAYFLFFFVQARVALHHFAPAMVLPLVVAARVRPPEGAALRRHIRWWLLGATVAIVLAAPRSLRIATATRAVGSSVAQQVGDRGTGDPAVYRAASLLSELFPASWSAAVPEEAYGGSPLSWLRYATDSVTTGTAYLLARSGTAIPAGGAVVAESGGARLVVLDSAALADHRALRPPTDTRSPILVVPRTTLFGPGGRHSVDLLERLRGAAR